MNKTGLIILIIAVVLVIVAIVLVVVFVVVIPANKKKKEEAELPIYETYKAIPAKGESKDVLNDFIHNYFNSEIGM